MSEPILKPVSDVLAELHAISPELHAAAELERNWVWVTLNMQPKERQPWRDAMKAMGFKYAKRGHACPSGAMSYWSHHCMHPTRFDKSKGKGKGKAGGEGGEPAATNEPSIDELLAVLGR